MCFEKVFMLYPSSSLLPRGEGMNVNTFSELLFKR